MIRRGLTAAGICLACLGLGFLAGRWTLPAAAPLTIGATTPKPERDLSPAGAPRTIIVTRIIPGPPAALPEPAQPQAEQLGHHLSTTETALPALATGGTFHSALFGQVEGPRLTLRTVEWLDTPAGRVPLGEASTRETVTQFPLPASRPLPRWTVAIAPGLRDGKANLGGLAQYARGPVVAGAGYVNGGPFGIVGVRW
ncbi:hypothetical protein [Geothrix campi]|uniref:hypothetical protein n=1 Tax=Geothrix campi TaxID=2966450 RepID=UPI0021491B0E|nr:hypothetical protein [Geothrix sp. SG10]